VGSGKKGACWLTMLGLEREKKLSGKLSRFIQNK
jgi:hypothetical protein